MTVPRQAIYTTEDFRDLVERGREWNFHDEDTDEHLHALHPYPAKFIPQIPRTAIERWSRPRELVYDPFCGCGTTLLEASLSGRRSVGTDNNAVAVLVTKAKLAWYTDRDLAQLAAFAAALEDELAAASARPDLIPRNKNFSYWYSDAVMSRLAALKGLILAEQEPLRTLLLAAFSSILVRVSYQDSDTRYARVLRGTDPRQVNSAFRAKLQAVRTRLAALLQPGRAESSVHQADARKVPMIASKSVDLIVTSPPYLNAYDYHKYHRQRLHWIDGDIAFARDLEIGSHDEFTRANATPDAYFADMDACFGEWARILRPRAHVLVVVGDAIVSKQPVRVADRLSELLAARGVMLQERWVRELHATKRAFNVRNSRITHEHVLLFRHS